MALCNFGHFYLVSKISQKLLELEPRNLINRLITKTCLYSFDPIKPHFYIVKLGFTGVYIIFLISAQKQIVGIH